MTPVLSRRVESPQGLWCSAPGGRGGSGRVSSYPGPFCTQADTWGPGQLRGKSLEQEHLQRFVSKKPQTLNDRNTQCTLMCSSLPFRRHPFPLSQLLSLGCELIMKDPTAKTVRLPARGGTPGNLDGDLLKLSAARTQIAPMKRNVRYCPCSWMLFQTVWATLFA